MNHSADTIRCKAKLLRPAIPKGASWSFLVLPTAASAKLPTRGMVTVDGLLDGHPFQVSEGAFTTLERRSLAKLEVDSAESIDYAAEVAADASVVNDAVGRFALWGFPDAPDRKLLPPGK